MKLIFGLGNPGREYEKTRHNAGFMAVDRIAAEAGIELFDGKFKGICGKGILEGEKILLVKPLTYMNSSGECVRAAADFYKAEPKDILIIYDDIDIAPGQIRVRKKGSAGSHNGMKSVIAHLGTTEFTRIRIGTGAKPEGWDLADYVLGRPDGADEVKINEALARVPEILRCILTDGTDAAMCRFNAKDVQ